MPNDVYFYIKYKSLKRIIHNFKRDAIRINCAKMIYKCADDNIRFPKHFKDYFRNFDTDIFR
jgi:hypothetical protein